MVRILQKIGGRIYIDNILILSIIIFPLLTKNCIQYKNYLPTRYLGSLVSGEFESVSKPGGKANQGVPDQLGGFKDIALKSDITCLDSGGFFSEDDLTCSYNFDMSFCHGINNQQDDDCYQGSFSAFSKGIDNIDITGGHGDFSGAFGQVRHTTRLLVVLRSKRKDQVGS